MEEEIEIYVCPTCKEWRYLEVYPSINGVTSYCRKCEEGCVTPAVKKVPRDPQMVLKL